MSQSHAGHVEQAPIDIEQRLRDTPPVPLPRVEGAAFSGVHVPLIERYHERLPFEPGDKLVSLQEGSTPLLRAPVISEIVGATVRLKRETIQRSASDHLVSSTGSGI